MVSNIKPHISTKRHECEVILSYDKCTTKLGQGNIFISMCQKFCSHLGAVHAGRYRQQAVGMHPTGMYTCISSIEFE